MPYHHHSVTPLHIYFHLSGIHLSYPSVNKDDEKTWRFWSYLIPIDVFHVIFYSFLTHDHIHSILSFKFQHAGQVGGSNREWLAKYGEHGLKQWKKTTQLNNNNEKDCILINRDSSIEIHCNSFRRDNDIWHDADRRSGKCVSNQAGNRSVRAGFS